MQSIFIWRKQNVEIRLIYNPMRFSFREEVVLYLAAEKYWYFISKVRRRFKHYTPKMCAVISGKPECVDVSHSLRFRKHVSSKTMGQVLLLCGLGQNCSHGAH